MLPYSRRNGNGCSRASAGQGRRATRAQAGKGEVYFRNMMANKARRGGAFIKQPPQQPPPPQQQPQLPPSDAFQSSATAGSSPRPSSAATPLALPSDASPQLLRDYLEGLLHAHWTGRPAPRWLADGDSNGSLASSSSNSNSRTRQGGRQPQGSGTTEDEDGVDGEEGAAAAAAARAAARRANKGVVIPPPASLRGPQTHTLPSLPGIRPPVAASAATAAAADATASGTSSGSGRATAAAAAATASGSSSGSGSSLGSEPAAEGQVFVFWDLEDKHPGSLDPRVVVHRLREAAAWYGQVSGIYAYATRKVSNWVPDALYEVAMDARAKARQQQQLQRGSGDLQAAAAHRCPVCGAARRSAAELAAHVEALHGRRSGGGGTAAGGGAAAPRNGPSRAVGRVVRYANSSGDACAPPPPGHMLSLRYVLRCERGVEARVAQNALEDSGIALASGLMRLLSQLQQGGGDMTGEPGGSAEGLGRPGDAPKAASPQLLPGRRPVAVVVSDDVRLAWQLDQLSAAGFGIVLVSSDPRVLAAGPGGLHGEAPWPGGAGWTRATGARAGAGRPGCKAGVGGCGWRRGGLGSGAVRGVSWGASDRRLTRRTV